MNTVTESRRIDIGAVDLTDRKNTEYKECSLTLYPNRIQYKCVGEYDSDDNEEGIMKHYRANVRWCLKREQIGYVEMVWSNSNEVWEVIINFLSGAVTFSFADPKVALGVYKELEDYYLNELKEKEEVTHESFFGENIKRVKNTLL